MSQADFDAKVAFVKSWTSFRRADAFAATPRKPVGHSVETSRRDESRRRRGHPAEASVALPWRRAAETSRGDAAAATWTSRRGERRTSVETSRRDESRRRRGRDVDIPQRRASHCRYGGGKVTSDEKLKCYGLFKQVTVGDNAAAKPWAVQLEASAKWHAWESRKGMTKDAAITAYIAEVDAQYLCCADIPWRGRGAAAAATRIFRGGVAAPPRLRRGYSVEQTARPKFGRDRRAPQVREIRRRAVIARRTRRGGGARRCCGDAAARRRRGGAAASPRPRGRYERRRHASLLRPRDRPPGTRAKKTRRQSSGAALVQFATTPEGLSLFNSREE